MQIKKLLPLAPIFTGSLVFFALYGLRPLNPGDLNWWGLSGDGLQSWLGWTFFRNSPWTFPLGLNPAYGLELNNLVIYTDSIPLLALAFKIFSPLLPPVFQYLGWWTFSCFIFQAYFGWKLATLGAREGWLQWLGCLLFLFAPILFFRLNGHFTLTGQFLILAALYLCLAPSENARYRQWLLLVCLCAFIHAYLLCMVLFLWLGWLGMAMLRYHYSYKRLFGHIALVLVSLASCCWALGYFSLTPEPVGGFGSFKMNVLSLFDAGNTSLILPDLPSLPDEYEGFNYMGAGCILLMLITLPTAWIKRMSLLAHLRHWLPLVLICILLTAIALTNIVSIGSYSLLLPMPEVLDPWMQAFFRASGRFFWPVYYLIVFSLICLVAKNFRPRLAALTLATAAILQIIDIQPLFMAQRVKNVSLLENYALEDKLWRDPGFSEIRLLPFSNARQGWEKTGIFAALHALGTNHVYVSRIDRTNLEKLRKQEQELIVSGNLEPNVIYITDEATFAKLTAMSENISARYVDGFPVLTRKKASPE